jgi:pyrroline-5-carboxylate reductase
MSEGVAIIGAGRLGESLARGLLSSEWRAPEAIVATSRRPERLAELTDRYGITTTSDNRAAVEGAGLIVVAVKPQDMTAVLAEISPSVSPEQTVLSVAAGIRTASIEAHLPLGSRVVRAMPNAPALVHEGIAGLCGGANARDVDLDLAGEALGHLGAVVRVAEDDMDAVTALSGSGPAYFALLAEAMIEAGLLLGLSRDVSTRLVVQTMFGSALLLRDERMHPVELREAVTSPGGTTTRAIQELERSGVRAAFLNAITAATERSRELAARVSDD